MRAPSLAPRPWRLLLPFLLLTLTLALGLVACADASTPAGGEPSVASPERSEGPTADQSNDGGSSGRGPSEASPEPVEGPQRSALSKSETSAGGSGGATQPMMAAPDPNMTYQWIGEILAGDGRGIELRSSICGGEVWALTFADPDLEKKAASSDGQKVIIWGKVSTKSDVSIQPLAPTASADTAVYSRPAIAV
ncbi:MAG: hypothetical protein FJ320_06305 [SAR202 cluster bacterium]|nr:hypothetical protein [SAR202 cluster bacterium]